MRNPGMPDSHCKILAGLCGSAFRVTVEIVIFHKRTIYIYLNIVDIS